MLVALVATVAELSRRLLPVPRNGGNGVARVATYLPLTTAFAVALVPLAAALYLATTTTWSLAERLVLRQVLGG